ncbi:hypothetical protein [uncultured Proteiniphilum sp.]|uniref:hypothetical protein n=1 Tax=uncultured Proteiniphilum sp. TaxID=497637 RepID=UPI00260F2BC9|nr:hypothetical protein [uncultured Proteiniphilum sp.]
MKHLCLYLFLLLSTIAYIPSTYAQQYAVTEDGRRVILHRDGTWEYLHIPEHHPQGAGESGKKARIFIGEEIMIFLHNGQLEDFSILTGGSRLYDKMNGKLKQIGRHEIEYDFHTDRVKKIGGYAIEYDFHTDRVKKIGDYPVEYDFHTEKISRIGNTRFEYSFFNGKLTDISGRTPGIEITMY